MTLVLILAAPADGGDAQALDHALCAAGFQAHVKIAGQASPPVEGEADGWDCLVLCWSKAAREAGIDNDEHARKAIRQKRCIPVLLERGVGFEHVHPVDLSLWRRGRTSNLIEILADRLRLAAGEFRNKRFRFRLFTWGGALLFVTLISTLADRPKLLCPLPYVRPICSRLAIGGIPTARQEADYQRALAGGCPALREFVRTAEGNPRLADARRKLDGIRPMNVLRRWPETHRLPLHVSGPVKAARRQAEAAAVSSAETQARNMCSGFGMGGAWRFRSSGSSLGPLSCDSNADGWRCYAGGSAICHLEALETRRVEVCY